MIWLISCIFDAVGLWTFGAPGFGGWQGLEYYVSSFDGRSSWRGDHTTIEDPPCVSSKLFLDSGAREVFSEGLSQ